MLKLTGGRLPGRIPMTVHKNLQEQVKHYYREVENYDWTRAADAFIGLESFFHRSRCKETLRLVAQFVRQGRVLDVGCGTALITRRLPGVPVGVDLNPRNLRKARVYAPKARLVLCDVEGTLAFRENSFDAAVCTEILEHLLEPFEALREVQRVLKPRGVLIGSVPGRSPIWKLRGLSSSRGAFRNEPYHKHYRREELRRLLTQYFAIRQLYARNLQMNWFFAAHSLKGA